MNNNNNIIIASSGSLYCSPTVSNNTFSISSSSTIIYLNYFCCLCNREISSKENYVLLSHENNCNVITPCIYYCIDCAKVNFPSNLLESLLIK